MSESVHLDVYFKTNNPLPLRELRGIFHNQFQELSVVQEVPKEQGSYTVVIHEWNLVEALEGIQGVIQHCKKNSRTVSITVTHGSIF